MRVVRLVLLLAGCAGPLPSVVAGPPVVVPPRPAGSEPAPTSGLELARRDFGRDLTRSMYGWPERYPPLRGFRPW